MSEPETYNFHLIFKGLFRCVPDKENGKLSILLVDARSPKMSKVTGEPLRDHRAVIEFRLKDWRNRALDPLRNFVEVNKRNKDEVGLYLLDREDIRIGLSSGDFSPGLRFIEDTPNSFLRLPQMAEIAPSFAGVRAASLSNKAENCIARVLSLDRGIVSSERLSTLGGEPLRWAFSIPRTREVVGGLIRTASPERDRLHQEFMANGKVFNLDLKVTMQVPVDASVIIDPAPFPNVVRVDPPAFLLRPADGGALDVWIKNRELDVILTESDKEGREEGCLDTDFIDFDFELIYDLSPEGENRDKRIPYRSDALSDRARVSNGGCACGGCA